MRTPFSSRTLFVAVAFVFALSGAVVLVGQLDVPLAPDMAWDAGLVLMAVALTWPCYHGLRWGAKPVLGPWSKRGRRRIVLACSAASLLLLVAWPLSPPPQGVHRLAVRNTGDKDPLAKGAEVWIQALRIDGHAIAPGDWLTPSPWRHMGTAIVSAENTTGAARWEGGVGATAQLDFTHHPWSGHAEVTWDDAAQPLDLFSPSPYTGTLELRVPPPSTPRLVLWWSAHWVCLTLFLSMLFALFGRRRPSSAEARPLPFWGTFASVALGGLLYLLALYPGAMTSDSLDQWSQMETWNLSDNHPAFHTLTNWLLTRLWHSPAAIGLSQVLVFSALIALFIKELGRMGASRWSQGLTVVLAALWPLIGVNLVTLWKDIPFSLGVLGLTYCILRLIRTEGGWVRQRVGFVGLLISSLVVLFYRHNGILVVAGTYAVLLLIRGFPRQRLLMIAGLSLAIFFAAKGPLYRALDVQPANIAFKLQNQIHQMGAMISSGAALTEEDKTLLQSIEPLQEWTNRYTCYSAGPLLYNTDFDFEAFARQTSAFLRLFFRLAPTHLGALWDRQWCISSLVWRVEQPSDGYLSTWALHIDNNDLKLQQKSLFPSLKKGLEGLDNWSKQPSLMKWTWRPATYLYWTLFALALVSLRADLLRLLLLGLPVVANSIVMMILTPSQSSRYQLCVYMLALLTPVLLSAARARNHSANEAPDFVKSS